MEGTWRLSEGQNSYDLYILFDFEFDILLIIQQNLNVIFIGKNGYKSIHTVWSQSCKSNNYTKKND